MSLTNGKGKYNFSFTHNHIYKINKLPTMQLIMLNLYWIICIYNSILFTKLFIMSNDTLKWG